MSGSPGSDANTAQSEDASESDIANDPRDAGLPDFGPATGDYSCLGEAPPTPENATATMAARVSSFRDGAGIASVTIDVCTNPSCSPPASSVTTGAGGTVALELPLGSDGFGGPTTPAEYLAVHGPTAASTLYFFPKPIVADSGLNVVILREADRASLLAAAGVEDDASRGMVFSQVRDCAVKAVAGAVAELDGGDEKTRLLYFASDAPSPDAEATDASATFVAVGVPDKTAVTLRARDGNTVIGPTQGLIRGGWVSEIFVMP
jgi:hypothetical protein